MTTMEPPAKQQKTDAAAQARKGSAAAGLAEMQLQAANIIVHFRSDDGQLTGLSSPPPLPPNTLSEGIPSVCTL